MRIFALLSLCCLAFVGFRRQNATAPTCSADLPQCSSATVSAISQTQNILFQTIDGGETWQDLSAGLPENFVANSAFSQNGVMYLADRGGVVYQKGNHTGSKWEREEFAGILSDAGGIFPSDLIVNGIFAGSAQPYATVYDNGLFRRNSGTGQWESMNEALLDKRVYAFVENPDGALFIGGDGGIYKSMDDGKSWKQVFSEGFVTQLAASEGVLMASAQNGLIRSTDGGQNWDCVLPDPNGRFDFNLSSEKFVAIRAAGIVINSANAISLQSSVDAGKTWQPMYTGPMVFKGVYSYKKAGKNLFCCHKGGVSRSKDDGNTWELVREAIDNDKVPMRYELIVSGETVTAVLVFAGC